MARQNRVDPFGCLFVDTARGTLMGNRGCLHDGSGQLTTKRWTRNAWVTCLLEFKDRHRTIMAPNQYTELFFLDEATAFSAGHRPCAKCRRESYNGFKRIWLSANAGKATDIKGLDQVLHAERADSAGHKRTWSADLGDLIDGMFVVVADRPAVYFDNRFLAWSPSGYREVLREPSTRTVRVLTPTSVARAFSAGYTPKIHPSAQALLDR